MSMIISFIYIVKILWNEFLYTMKDIRGEYVFYVDGCEITATFAEKRNDEIVPWLQEILFGAPHIRQKPSSDCRIKEKNKEAV